MKSAARFNRQLGIASLVFAWISLIAAIGFVVMPTSDKLTAMWLGGFASGTTLAFLVMAAWFFSFAGICDAIAASR